jgi:hypothetical protein
MRQMGFMKGNLDHAREDGKGKDSGQLLPPISAKHGM